MSSISFSNSCLPGTSSGHPVSFQIVQQPSSHGTMSFSLTPKPEFNAITLASHSNTISRPTPMINTQSSSTATNLVLVPVSTQQHHQQPQFANGGGGTAAITFMDGTRQLSNLTTAAVTNSNSHFPSRQTATQTISIPIVVRQQPPQQPQPMVASLTVSAVPQSRESQPRFVTNNIHIPPSQPLFHQPIKSSSSHTPVRIVLTSQPSQPNPADGFVTLKQPTQPTNNFILAPQIEPKLTFTQPPPSFSQPARHLPSSRVPSAGIIPPLRINLDDCPPDIFDKPRSRKRNVKKLYDCNVCNKSFEHKSSLQRHERTHTGEKPFQCSVVSCGKRFADSSALYKHKIVHTKERKFLCTHCGKRFGYNHVLKRHVNSIHRKLRREH